MIDLREGNEVSGFTVFKRFNFTKGFAHPSRAKFPRLLVLFCFIATQILFSVHAQNLDRPLEGNDQALHNKVSMQSEIAHLLNFVKNTKCEYERNGKKHNGKDAAKHIKKKYDYYQDDIDSTEKFIELSASKSSMSGKAYKIYCPDKPVLNSQEWLISELANFREKHG